MRLSALARCVLHSLAVARGVAPLLTQLDLRRPHHHLQVAVFGALDRHVSQRHGRRTVTMREEPRDRLQTYERFLQGPPAQWGDDLGWLGLPCILTRSYSSRNILAKIK